MRAKVFTIGEFYKGGRVRPFSRVRRGKMEYVPGFERKSSRRPIADVRAYPDAASQRTAERAMKEVGAKPSEPHKVIEPLDINSKRWNEIEGKVETAKEKHGVEAEGVLRKEIKKITDPNELNAFMRVLKDKGFNGLAAEVDDHGRKLHGSQWARMYYANVNKGENTMEDKEKAVKKTLIIDPLNLFVRVVDAPDLEKAGPPGPGLAAKKVPVKGKTGSYQATRYTRTGEAPKGPPKPGGGGAPGQEQQPSTATLDTPAKAGDRILIEGRHAIVVSSGEHGVMAHEADGTQHQSQCLISTRTPNA